MFYALMGYTQAKVEWRLRAIRSLLSGERGQGTVEYVGLILLVSLLMVGMVAAMKGFNRYSSKTSVTARRDGIGNSPNPLGAFRRRPNAILPWLVWMPSCLARPAVQGSQQPQPALPALVDRIDGLANLPRTGTT